MTTVPRVSLDDLFRDLTVVGFLALLGWALVWAVGTAYGAIRIDPQASLRFLLAILILVFARRPIED